MRSTYNPRLLALARNEKKCKMSEGGTPLHRFDSKSSADSLR